MSHAITLKAMNCVCLSLLTVIVDILVTQSVCGKAHDFVLCIGRQTVPQTMNVSVNRLFLCSHNADITSFLFRVVLVINK